MDDSSDDGFGRDVDPYMADADSVTISHEYETHQGSPDNFPALLQEPWSGNVGLLDSLIGEAITRCKPKLFEMIELDPFKSNHLSYEVFGKSYDLNLRRQVPAVFADPEPIQTVLSRECGSISISVRKRIPQIRWPESLVLKRQKAITAWRMIVEDNPNSTEVGMQLQEAVLGQFGEDFIVGMIRDVFQSRATSTLSKRAAALMKFLKWMRTSYGRSPFPVKEDKAYEYVRLLIKSKAAATEPSGFRSALSFAAELLKLQGAELAANSGRLRGAVNGHLLTKPQRKFAKRLKLDMARVLEHAVFKAVDPPNRIAAGYFTIMLHGRPRLNDLMFAEKLELDVDAQGFGFIEAAASRVKTARTTELKSMLMPLVAPAQGLLDKPWAVEWMKQREYQGVARFESRLPTIGIDGKFHDHPCDSATANRWLRKILIDGGISADRAEEADCHGLKATSLSWCSKYGMQLVPRQLLGRHVPANMTSALTYSRDELTEPLRQYDTLLRDIRSGLFNPDLPRSKIIQARELLARTDLAQIYAGNNTNPSLEAEATPLPLSQLETSWTPPDDRMQEEFTESYPEWTWEEGRAENDHSCPIDGRQIVAVSESDSDESLNDSSDDSESSSEGEEPDVPVRLRTKLNEFEEVNTGKLFVCRSSQLLHFYAGEMSSQESELNLISMKFRCGKFVTRSFIKVSSDEASNYLCCLRCFTNNKTAASEPPLVPSNRPLIKRKAQPECELVRSQFEEGRSSSSSAPRV